MSFFHLSLICVYACVLLVWVARHFVTSRTYRATPLLTPRDPAYKGDPPLVSVLIPAKDEEASIRDCVLSVLTQNYRKIEVLVDEPGVGRSKADAPEIDGVVHFEVDGEVTGGNIGEFAEVLIDRADEHDLYGKLQ